MSDKETWRSLQVASASPTVDVKTHLSLLVLNQYLPHLGCPLPQRLARLLPSAVVPDLEPEPEFVVLLQEPPVQLADGADYRSRDGRLVVLPGLQVRPPVGVDQVAEAAIARVDVRAASPAAEDVVPGVELDPLGRRGGEAGGAGDLGLLVGAAHDMSEVLSLGRWLVHTFRDRSLAGDEPAGLGHGVGGGVHAWEPVGVWLAEVPEHREHVLDGRHNVVRRDGRCGVASRSHPRAIVGLHVIE